MNATVFNDRDLKDMMASLDSILINSPEPDLVADIIAELETAHGSGNVNQSPSATEFVWEWDPVGQVWVKREKSTTTVLVDDGNTTDVQIVIEILDVVA
ncbi:MAG: hypothetical protein ACI9F9_000990 [Candidatus Paceibacteria bacterium]|jgi:hypothetical protein